MVTAAMTLDQAETAFKEQRNNATAGRYLRTLMEYEADDMIGDDTWLDGLASIAEYLLDGKIGEEPTEAEQAKEERVNKVLAEQDDRVRFLMSPLTGLTVFEGCKVDFDKPKAAYRFHLVCPRCNKISETTQDHRVPEPHVSCGDCLMDHTEVVNLKVVKVEEVK